jgi:hypothetical protein
MKKNILGIILVIFLLFVLFLIKEKFTQAQSPIGIELYVYPRGFYGGGNLIKIDNADSDIYKTSRNSTVVAGTEYQLRLINVGNNNFTLKFYRGGTLVMSTSSNCASILGKPSGPGNSNCIIEGTFNQPSIDYEKWTIIVTSSASQASTSFYLVKQSYAQNIGIASKNDQYYLEPTSTTTQPTSTINYTVYSNKLYCPSYMASGESKVTPNPSTGRFENFKIDNSAFINKSSISATLKLLGIPQGNYNVELVNSSNQRIGPPSPVQVRIKVQPPSGGGGGAPPGPGAFQCPGASGNQCRCVFSYCYWRDPNTGNWIPTSSSVCGNVCTGGIRE